MKKISQREARSLRKRVAELEKTNEQNASAWAREYIGGVQSTCVASLNEGVVRHLYCDSRMSQREIAVKLAVTQRSVCLFMKRCGIKARVAAKRDQRGERNSSWRGDRITYGSAHRRVYRERGSPQLCEHCLTSDPQKCFEWANVSGKHSDPNDYIRLCRSCHCKFDGLIKNLGSHAKRPRHAAAAVKASASIGNGRLHAAEHQ